jgi:hypothetical protein
MRTESSLDLEELEGEEISRGETGIRILLSLLFALVWSVVEMVLLALVVFELAFALITERAPGDRIRGFANRVVSYAYRIFRYLTYNDEVAPFPFSDWPSEIEPSHPVRPSDGGDPDFD